MKKTIQTLFAALMVSAIMTSCEKKDPPSPDPVPEDGTGKVKLEFANKVGSSNLSLNDQSYVNEHGDTFKVSIFDYYITNVKLNGAKGTYTESESYHLIKQEDATSLSFDLSDVPYDTYTSVTLMIGVDSLRNVSGAQSGALDPAHGMFWTWSTGYIMVKMEGTSPQSGASNKGLIYHAAGFAGANATQRTVTLTFPTAITVSKSGDNHVHIDADVNAMFKSPNVIDFASHYTINSVGTNAKMLADNYANMLTVSYAGL